MYPLSVRMNAMNAMCRSAVRATYATCGGLKMASQHVRKPIRQNADLRTVRLDYWKTELSLRPLSEVTRETRPLACLKELSHILQGT